MVLRIILCVKLTKSLYKEIYHQSGDDNIEDCPGHRLLEYLTLFALKRAGGGGYGNALRRDNLAARGSYGVAGCKPFGRDIDMSCHCGLHLAEKDVRGCVATGDEGANASHQRGKQRIERTCGGSKTAGNHCYHSCIIHHGGETYKTDDCYQCCLESLNGFPLCLEYAAHGCSLDESADECADEEQYSGMGEPRNLIVADAIHGEMDCCDEGTAECGTK